MTTTGWQDIDPRDCFNLLVWSNKYQAFFWNDDEIEHATDGNGWVFPGRKLSELAKQDSE